MEPLTTLGFWQKSVCIRNPVKKYQWGRRRHVYVRFGKANKRIFVLVGGYAQPVGSWYRFIKDVMSPNDTIIVISRGNDAGNHPGYTSYTTLGSQIAEVGQIFDWVLHNLLKPNQKVDLIGHSAGALFCRQLTLLFPKNIRDVFQIAPLPENRWSIIKNASFWQNGGFSALTSTIRGLFIESGEGVLIPYKPAKTLFSSPLTEPSVFASYYGTLLRDSVIAFFQMALTYSGGELIKAKSKGWEGNNTVFYCSGDAIMNFVDSRAMTINGQGQLVILPQITPHCFTLSPEDTWQKLAALFKSYIFPTQ